MKMTLLARTSSSEGKAHQHKEGQLFLIHQGLMVLETDKGQWVMPAHMAGWIPPACVHQAKSYGPLKGSSFYLAPKFCTNLPKQPFVFTPNPLLLEIMLRFSFKQNITLTKENKHLMLVMCDEIKATQPSPLYLPMPKEIRLEKIAKTILFNPDQNQTLSQWASTANMTTRTFTRHFRKETGMSFAKWQQTVCLMKALAFLAKGKSVTWISFTLGYQSISAFIRVFKDFMGMTPTAYQKSPLNKL